MDFKIFDPVKFKGTYDVFVDKIIMIFDGTCHYDKAQKFQTLLRYMPEIIFAEVSRQDHWYTCEVHVHPLRDSEVAKEKLISIFNEVFLNIAHE